MNYELDSFFGETIEGVFYPKIKLSSGILRVCLLNTCNYRCPHCFQEGEKKLKDQILPLKHLKRIIDFAKKYYGLHTVKFTGGEPLLYPELEELLKYMSENNLNSEFTTNGYLLEEKLSVLSENQVKYITVTLNTINKDTYLLLHRCPNNALEKSLQGIIKAESYGIKVRLNLIALDIEEQNILDVMDFACKYHLVMRVCEPTYVVGADTTCHKQAFHKIYKYVLENQQSSTPSLCKSVEYIKMKSGLELTVMHNLCDNRFCQSCGRYLYIRLTSDSKLKPCLSRRDTEREIPIGATEYEINQAFLYAINHMGDGLGETDEIGLKLDE